MTAILHDDELAALCRPLWQYAAMRKYLDRLAAPYLVGHDGRPLVGRNALDTRMSGTHLALQKEAGANTPDRAALLKRFSTKKGNRGTSSK